MAEAGERITSSLRRWQAIGPTTRVLAFDAMGDEPDVFAAADDGIALLTRTPDAGELTVHRADGPMERHLMGYRQPAAGSDQVPLGDIDVVLVPGLAFGRDGSRLGRGRGYYDQLLPRLRPGAVLVGVVPDACVVERVPVEAHDVAVTHLATESGVIAVGSVPAMDPDLRLATLDWIAGDPDPATRRELEVLLDRGAESDLADRMGGTLEFGTAGIRGEVGAGSNRMNRAVVIRTTAGLADFLADAGRSHGTVVLGYDARLSSRQFAEDAVGVLIAAGITVRYFDHPVPTPVVAHAARDLEAAAAVVVTASHNPPRDNGYKVYDVNAAQIVPPVDTRIAAAIRRVGPASEVPRIEEAMAGATERASSLGERAIAAYAAEVVERRPPVPDPGSMSIVYTPMHGVGRDTLLHVFDMAGYRNVAVVPEQGDPDGTFPTVAFPNPEEPGALDLAIDLARRIDADLVLANDPDADRLAVGVPEGGGFRTLTGNQVGVLLADFVLSRDTAGERLVVNSIVSSPMLEAVAEHHGARFCQTLTGFKWIANAAMDLERSDGCRFVFGFEEALGYSVGPVVRDKDGISAALWFADLAAWARAEGIGVLGYLERLYRRDDVWASVQKNVVRPGADGLAEIAAIMDRLRTDHPTELGGHRVDGSVDYRDNADRRPRWLPAAALVEFSLADAGRALVRPSGTEPKLKIYVDRRASVADDADVWGAEAAARVDALAIAEDLAGFLGLA